MHLHVFCLDTIQAPADDDASFCIGASGSRLKPGVPAVLVATPPGLRSCARLVRWPCCVHVVARYVMCGLAVGVHVSMLTLFVLGFYYVQEALADEECCGHVLGFDR